MRSTEVPASACPTCGAVLEMATSLADDVTPCEGTGSVCADCGAVLMFNADLSLRLMTDEERQSLNTEARDTLDLFQRFARDRARRRHR